MPELITSSRIKAFSACRKLHFYKYTLGYRPVVDSEALEFGHIFHAGEEAWWQAYARGQGALALSEALAAIGHAVEAAFSVDEATRVKLELLMIGYDLRWSGTMSGYEVIGVEQKFSAPLPTPTNARRARGLKVAGKLDVLVRRLSDGTVWIVEHKTTSADLSPGSTYWARLRMDVQVSVYFEAVNTLGERAAGCLYDVIAKPQQKPYKATPLELRKYTKPKVDKNGVVLDRGRLYANQRARDETMQEFRARIAEEIASAPEQYFQRQEVTRLDSELEQSRRDTYDLAMMIRDDRNRERAPRNPDACFLYGRACDFLPVCDGTAAIDDPTKFKKLADVHPELAA